MQSSAPNLATAAIELKAREPIFHHPEFGTSRADFESMVTKDFREVGASGTKYSKVFILDTLEERHKHRISEQFEISDFECRQLSSNIFLATYLLDQSGRLSRRSTIWRWEAGNWLIEFHQGTLVAG